MRARPYTLADCADYVPMWDIRLVGELGEGVPPMVFGIQCPGATADEASSRAYAACEETFKGSYPKLEWDASMWHAAALSVVNGN